MEIPACIAEAIIAHACFELPNEACGLLATDSGGRIRMCYSLTNAEFSPTTFTIDARGHLGALQHAERNGWELKGAFHSHPRSEAYPSETDVRLALESDWTYLIVGPVDPGPPAIRAYHIRLGRVVEVELEITVDGGVEPSS